MPLKVLEVFIKNKHTGTFGKVGTISFNGNKIITAGGGGCIITNNDKLGKKAKHRLRLKFHINGNLNITW